MEFYDTIADANILSLKSLHILIDKYIFGPHAGEIWQDRMVRTIQNFELFDHKLVIIFDKVLTPSVLTKKRR